MSKQTPPLKNYFKNAKATPPTDLDSKGFDFQPFNWQSPERLRKDFSLKWYLLTGAFFGLLVIFSILVLDSLLTAILFAVIFVSLVIYTRNTPNKIQYSLTSDGLFINDQLYAFGNFSSFGIVSETDYHMIIFMPAKRLATSLTIYFETKDGEAIVDILSQVLPAHTVEENLIDKLIRKLGL